VVEEIRIGHRLGQPQQARGLARIEPDEKKAI